MIFTDRYYIANKSFSKYVKCNIENNVELSIFIDIITDHILTCAYILLLLLGIIFKSTCTKLLFSKFSNVNIMEVARIMVHYTKTLWYTYQYIYIYYITYIDVWLYFTDAHVRYWAKLYFIVNHANSKCQGLRIKFTDDLSAVVGQDALRGKLQYGPGKQHRIK